ncbi:hypothetical protein [Variovorax arabinosiphilus]|uniref:hypothetical protein n=1 Tax=Variovorax arabinosiphilus TaxID=3053498 RepID=UPI002576507B|nr:MULTISPECIES: hypothetical protein [unclassified Variovorax]MDM0122594.1 hypothetical protein [Variovorax sp. J2L1-78]MDM0235357.1 hypothetical protein [Variovorax sp. J2R1-6]
MASSKHRTKPAGKQAAVKPSRKNLAEQAPAGKKAGSNAKSATDETASTTETANGPGGIDSATVMVNAHSPGIGDVVMLNNSDGTVLGPGRLCAERPGFGSACVQFGGAIGCISVTRFRLSVAPPGSDAPSCEGCDNC